MKEYGLIKEASVSEGCDKVASSFGGGREEAAC